MTLILETDGAFSDTLALDLPVMDGIASIGLFGGSLSQSLRNLADPDAPFVLGGPSLPTVDANSVLVHPQAFIDTRQAEGLDSTYFFISKLPAPYTVPGVPPAGRVFGTGSTGGNTAGKRVFYHYPAVQGDFPRLSFTSRSTDQTWEITWTGDIQLDTTAFQLAGLRSKSGGAHRIYNFSKSQVASTTRNDAYASVVDDGSVLLGTRRGAPVSTAEQAQADAVQLAMFVHYNRALSDAEVATTQAALRTIATTRGLTV